MTWLNMVLISLSAPIGANSVKRRSKYPAGGERPRGIHAAAPANAAGARMLKVDAPVRCAAGNKPLNPVIDTGR